MRLAQIARKVGKTPSEIARYLDENSSDPIEKDPNFKLTEDQVNTVLSNFEVTTKKEMEDNVQAVNEIEAVEEVNEEEVVVEEVETEVIDETVEEIVVELVDLEAPEASSEIATEIETNSNEVVSEDETQPSTEENEFFEAEVDPDAELIKAPTVKLDGLKILGKIELPENKAEPEAEVKTPEEIEAEEAAEIAALDAAMQSHAQDIKPKKKGTPKPAKKTTKDKGSESEYKDEKGIYHFSPKQKANREKRLKEIELKRQREAEKEKKRRHYENQVKNRPAEKSKKAKEKKVQKTQSRKAKKSEQKEAPKGLWQRFVHWLND